MPVGDRRRGLLGPFQRRGNDVGHVAGSQPVCDRLRLGQTTLGEVVVGQAAVEDALGVVHLTVAHHMDHGANGAAVAHDGLACAAARAAPGSAEAIRSKAASSRTAETNQVSKALGGG